MASVTRELFGGAITATLPADLVDASDIRQVPDTQELLLFPNSNISIVLEVLEKVAADDLVEAVKFHFDSLAHDNEAQTSTVLDIRQLEAAPHAAAGDGPRTPAPTVLAGTQQVAKFNRETPDAVAIFVALFRVTHKNVDLVLTFNVPTATEQAGGAVDEAGQAAARAQFEEAVRTLKIVDFGLFA